MRLKKKYPVLVTQLQLLLLTLKINELKGKIPNITNLASPTALTAFEKKKKNNNLNINKL